MYLSRPEKLPIQIELEKDPEAEGDFSGNVGEKEL